MGKEFNPHRIFSVLQNVPRIIVLYTNMAIVTSCENYSWWQRVITPVKTSLKNWIRVLSNFLTVIRVIILGVKTCEVFLCFLAIISLGSIALTSQWLCYINCFTSLVILGNPEADTGGKESLHGARNRSLIFFAQYFPARLDFPSPPISVPGFPRMVTREPVHRLLHRVWADHSILLTFSLLKNGAQERRFLWVQRETVKLFYCLFVYVIKRTKILESWKAIVWRSLKKIITMSSVNPTRPTCNCQWPTAKATFIE